MKTHPDNTNSKARSAQSNRGSEMDLQQRRLPIGAEVQTGGVHFRIWAPKSKFAAVRLGQDMDELTATSMDLEPEENGYFSGLITEASAGLLYQIQLDSGVFPDPASRFQPEGPHGPSQIVDPTQFRWTDSNWKGIRREGQIIYELHLGTFTKDGTWMSAMEQLPELARLGITTVEVMPVAEFAGEFGWGYDGVDLFAPTRIYGSPDDFRAFVNRAHELGLGVILDVVYNHFGPAGNYLKEFSEDYFTDRHKNEWGEAINFDGENCGPVREFFVANAGYWIDEFHLDGLRLDATQQIFDSSRDHILAAIERQVREAAKGRATFIVAENESQQSRLARDSKAGGYGLDALWNDDFHHVVRVAATGRSEAYYSDFLGTPQEIISAVKRGYLFQGQYFSWQKQRRGSSTAGLHPSQFVTFIENHDQVANSLSGKRLHQLTSPGCARAFTALLLLGPGTPMLFQGQEFASSAPFLFFADHEPELAKLVTAGRRTFLEQFPSVACAGSAEFLSDPESSETFARCRLDLTERQKHAGIYEMHRDLIHLRRHDPVFSRVTPGGVDGAVLGSQALVLRFFGVEQNDRLLILNFGTNLRFRSLSEPLVAPIEGRNWELKWSSDDPRYGGNGTPCVELNDGWRIPGQAAVVLEPGQASARKKPKRT